jgi:hypothetical protein
MWLIGMIVFFMFIGGLLNTATEAPRPWSWLAGLALAVFLIGGSIAIIAH